MEYINGKKKLRIIKKRATKTPLNKINRVQVRNNKTTDLSQLKYKKYSGNKLKQLPTTGKKSIN